MLTRYHGDAAVTSGFDILPAIDLRGGRVVRLQQGDFERETAFSDDPIAVARSFVDAGAQWLHVVDLDGGAPRPIGPEGASCWASSPDGKLLAVTATDGTLSLFAVDGGGSPKSVPGWPLGATPIQWSADGGSLFYTQSSDIPSEIRRFDLVTGRSQGWQQLVPADLAGVQAITSPLITADGRVYAYSFARLLSDLYVTSPMK